MSRTGLEHKVAEAATRATSDLGEFAAIAATYDVDRVNDRIRFGAFENTIARWQQSGKRVPLHWDHRGEASNVIGSVDPATMQEEAGLGLYVEGKLDLDDSQVAREAWRSMRDDRVSLSFGYLHRQQPPARCHHRPARAGPVRDQHRPVPGQPADADP